MLHSVKAKITILIQQAIQDGIVKDLNDLLSPQIRELADLVKAQEFEEILKLLYQNDSLFFYLPQTTYHFLLQTMLVKNLFDMTLFHYLIEFESAVYTQTESGGNSATHLAVMYSTPDIVFAIIKKCPKLDIYNSQRLTPIGLAIKLRKQETLEVLLKGDTKSLIETRVYGYSFDRLHEFVAVKYANTPALKSLIAAGFDEQKISNDGFNLLCSLANVKFTDDIPPCDIKSMFNYLYTILKIEKDNDKNNAHLNKVLELAINARNLEVIIPILELFEENTDLKLNSALFQKICKNQDVELMKLILEVAKTNFKKYFSADDIKLLLNEPYKQDCSFLVDLIGINYFKERKYLVLSMIKNRHAQILFRLIDIGLDINLYCRKLVSAEKKDNTPNDKLLLTFSLSSLNEQVLIPHKTQLWISNVNKGPLKESAAKCLTFRKPITKQKIKVISKSTMMHKAIKNRSFDILQGLMDRNANPLLMNSRGQTPLELMKEIYEAHTIFLSPSNQQDSILEDLLFPYEWLKQLEKYTNQFKSELAEKHVLTLRNSSSDNNQTNKMGDSFDSDSPFHKKRKFN